MTRYMDGSVLGKREGTERVLKTDFWNENSNTNSQHKKVLQVINFNGILKKDIYR